MAVGFGGMTIKSYLPLLPHRDSEANTAIASIRSSERLSSSEEHPVDLSRLFEHPQFKSAYPTEIMACFVSLPQLSSTATNEQLPDHVIKNIVDNLNAVRAYYFEDGKINPELKQTLREFFITQCGLKKAIVNRDLRDSKVVKGIFTGLAKTILVGSHLFSHLHLDESAVTKRFLGLITPRIFDALKKASLKKPFTFSEVKEYFNQAIRLVAFELYAGEDDPLKAYYDFLYSQLQPKSAVEIARIQKLNSLISFIKDSYSPQLSHAFEYVVLWLFNEKSEEVLDQLISLGHLSEIQIKNFIFFGSLYASVSQEKMFGKNHPLAQELLSKMLSKETQFLQDVEAEKVFIRDVYFRAYTYLFGQNLPVSQLVEKLFELKLFSSRISYDEFLRLKLEAVQMAQGEDMARTFSQFQALPKLKKDPAFIRSFLVNFRMLGRFEEARRLAQQSPSRNEISRDDLKIFSMLIHHLSAAAVALFNEGGKNSTGFKDKILSPYGAQSIKFLEVRKELRSLISSFNELQLLQYHSGITTQMYTDLKKIDDIFTHLEQGSITSIEIYEMKAISALYATNEGDAQKMKNEISKQVIDSLNGQDAAQKFELLFGYLNSYRKAGSPLERLMQGTPEHAKVEMVDIIADAALNAEPPTAETDLIMTSGDVFFQDAARDAYTLNGKSLVAGLKKRNPNYSPQDLQNVVRTELALSPNESLFIPQDLRASVPGIISASVGINLYGFRAFNLSGFNLTNSDATTGEILPGRPIRILFHSVLNELKASISATGEIKKIPFQAEIYYVGEQTSPENAQGQVRVDRLLPQVIVSGPDRELVVKLLKRDQKGIDEVKEAIQAQLLPRLLQALIKKIEAATNIKDLKQAFDEHYLVGMSKQAKSEIRQVLYSKMLSLVWNCETQEDLAQLFEAYQAAKYVQANSPFKALMVDWRAKGKVVTRYQDHYNGKTYNTSQKDSFIVLEMKAKERELQRAQEGNLLIAPETKQSLKALSTFQRKNWYGSNTFIVMAAAAVVLGAATGGIGAAVPLIGGFIGGLLAGLSGTSALLAASGVVIGALAVVATALSAIGRSLYNRFYGAKYKASAVDEPRTPPVLGPIVRSTRLSEISEIPEGHAVEEVMSDDGASQEGAGAIPVRRNSLVFLSHKDVVQAQPEATAFRGRSSTF